MGALAYIVLLLALINRAQVETTKTIRDDVAHTPPRGWNSYDSFAWVINEEEFMQNADIVSRRLLKHGYEYVVVDYLWYRRLTRGASRNSYGYDVIDQWGRVMPDPGRWPSSGGGNGFKEISQKVHDMGLKFGIHVMRGISVQAVDKNSPILDVRKGTTYEEERRQWRAQDIGIRERTCAWMNHGFMSVNTDLGAGRAFLRSLYSQYAEWGVDFLKLDCVFGDDLDGKEIVTVSELLQELERPVILSLSPGTHVTSDMAKLVSEHANMYRITGDDWDTWPDIEAHFDIARDVAAYHLIGSKGLNGRSWPDLDMLPFGWLTNSYGNVGPYRKCNLTADEQKTEMTLWSMVKSPLIFGGDLRNTDEATIELITNPTLMEINSFSTNNKEFQSIIFKTESKIPSIHGYRHQKVLNKTFGSRVCLTSCSNPLAKAWSTQGSGEEPNQIRWRSIPEDENCTVFNMDESTILMKLGDGYEQKDQRELHILSMEDNDLCLDVSSSRRPTASELNFGYFSTCEWRTSQLWELSDDGFIRSNYSGLCLVMETENKNVNAGGGRAWIATGRRGEVYLSFFNLNTEIATIGTRIQDVKEALPSGFFSKKSCNCIEVWSGRNLGVINSTLSVQVPGHGCALFLLHCS